ncbi:MAG: hypothetical protein HC929_10660 [Leptolyngbyaceae cyanobacterium SM2_5_2]|nr:hypothetical protein [Leptolyngbyaceae cyanobacterium SM2_5_2]
MKRHLLSIGFVGLSLVSLSLPAMARPEIASGDQLLETDVAGCLSLADQYIAELGVESDQGSIDRTGYFEDGSFRILCYGAGEASLAIVFATHNESLEVAANFIQMTLAELARGQSVSQQPDQAQPAANP